jgi:soluble lytic murein transglycosylase
MRIPRSISAIVLAAILVTGPAMAKSTASHGAQQPERSTPAAAAIRAADGNRWAEAQEIAAKSGDPLLQKLVDWLDFSRPGTDASFERISYFVKNNPRWPGIGTLRKRAEDALPSSLSPEELVAWFQQSPPTSPDTVPAYYDALVRLGREAEAKKLVRDFLVSGNFSAPQLHDYGARFQAVLQRQDYAARADQLIWDGAYIDARNILPMLDRDDQAADNARIVLSTDAPGAEAAIAELPGDRQRDPGVLFARIKYEMGQLRDDEAAALFAKEPAQPPHVSAWSSARLLLARRMIEAHDYRAAYNLAAGDHSYEPAQIAETEFLAGWIALRFVEDRPRALAHFKYMYAHVTTPLSKARAAYWMARAVGDKESGPDGTAEDWYRKAAEYPTTFYGQLALEELDQKLVLPPEPRPTAAEESSFERDDLVRAVRLLHQAGDATRVAQFLKQLGEIETTPAGQAQTVHLARDVGVIPMSVTIAKKALSNNICVLASGYPVLSSVSVREPEPALVHSIIRQESLFNPEIVSPAGAIGLMQLMPATAAIEAKKLGQKHGVTPIALRNPAENVTLGAHYLGDMISNFGGSYVLAIASYNAGPGHVHNWLGDNGDPRNGVDPVDWIELIPISETRNYVQRVLENLQVYRAKLAGGSTTVRLEEDLKR